MSRFAGAVRVSAHGFVASLLPARAGSPAGGRLRRRRRRRLRDHLRIDIRPGGQLLTADRQSAQLSAIAYDADGEEVDADFAWTSSTPDQIAVDGHGTVSASSELGSATITAEADAETITGDVTTTNTWSWNLTLQGAEPPPAL